MQISKCFARLLLALAIIAARVHASAETDRIVLPDTLTPSHYELELTPDAAAASFTAVVHIRIEIHQPTPEIKLNAANLVFSRVRLSGENAAPTVSFDEAQQTATLHFRARLKPGPHVLSIRYTGRINADPTGLFFLDYDSDTGPKRALYTQLENSDARRLFPGWDEPNRKATFTLTVNAPAADMAVSNMPAAHVSKLPGGMVRTTFRTTPKMSSYLLFLALGDFERDTRRVGGVEIGVVYRRGDSAKARFALDAASRILPYYEDYFGIRYPLPKLDLVAGPGESQFFGAMENWGAIFAFDRYMLVDPDISTQAETVNAFVTVAHEMAHQWFGDLVTMDWWNDLWLNEGFAEWMQYKAMDRFHPEWEPWLQALMERESAMDPDSRASAHPVITPIPDVLESNNYFDDITYDKGMSVVRMLERDVGETAFRDGIRRYLRAHAYGNAVTDDLWRELDRTAASPISQIAHEFTLQAGIPLIRVTAAARVHLEQGSFTTDASGAQPVWHVPVVVQPLQGTEWRGIVSANSPIDLAVSPAKGVVVNAGQSGYFRTLYAPSLLVPLSASFGSLKPVDQLGLLLDAKALGLAGYEPLPDFLQLALQVGPGMQPMVQSTVADTFGELARLYRGRSDESGFRTFAGPALARLFAAVGWNPAPGESGNIRLLRAKLIVALSNLDDETVVRRAGELFATYIHAPGSLDAELRRQVLTVEAQHADASIWEQFHVLAKTAHSGIEKQLYYAMLGSVEDAKLAQRALDLLLTDEIEPTTRPWVIDSVATRFPEMAFDFAVAHRDQVNTWVEPYNRDLYQARLLKTSADPAALVRLKAYVESHIKVSDRSPAEEVESQIPYNMKVRTDGLPQIDAWLKTRS
jgi:Peptidase family M1 domain/Peptidase M1 N-terminal domain/ERAP1-like C-terminal domain